MSTVVRRRLRHALIWSLLLAGLQAPSLAHRAEPGVMVWTPLTLVGGAP